MYGEKQSVDLAAHEIDFKGITIDKTKKEGSKKASLPKRGESPLRTGASMQLSTKV